MPGASSSSNPTFQHHAPLQPTQWHQRNVHTHTFKIFEYGCGNRSVELMVEDSSGHTCVRSMEQFFYGIIGHVRSTWICSWWLASGVPIGQLLASPFLGPRRSSSIPRLWHPRGNWEHGWAFLCAPFIAASCSDHSAGLAPAQHFMSGSTGQWCVSYYFTDFEHGSTNLIVSNTLELGVPEPWWSCSIGWTPGDPIERPGPTTCCSFWDSWWS